MGQACHSAIPKDEIKNRSKLVYQADDTEAINLPCKSPSLINLYEKLLKENADIADKKSFILILRKEMYYYNY